MAILANPPATPAMAATMPPKRSLPGAAALLGFALGGFFDGILLHQVLQWHHLLSNVGAVTDLRAQLLADGLFHALMYVLLFIALVLLWRGRASLGGAAAVLAATLVGFGLWHVADTLLSHWITGIHRIRGDAPNPLFWDLLWLVLFGLLPLGFAIWLRRKPPAAGDGGRAAGGLAVLALLAGSWAAWPAPREAEGDLVLFAPGVTAAEAFDVLARLDARVRWVDASGGIWAVHWDRRPSAVELLMEGALLAGGPAIGLGCASWSRPQSL